MLLPGIAQPSPSCLLGSIYHPEAKGRRPPRPPWRTWAFREEWNNLDRKDGTGLESGDQRNKQLAKGEKTLKTLRKTRHFRQRAARLMAGSENVCGPGNR